MKGRAYMKKLMITLFLALIILASVIAINPSHASTTTTISIASTTQQFPSAIVGNTIQVNIVINNVQGLWAWDIAGLTFNPAYLSITSVSEGPFLKSAGNSLLIWTSNSAIAFAKGVIPDISDILLEYSTASGSGVLVTLTFTVKSLGTSQIKFNQTTLDSDTNVGTSTNPVYEQIPCTNINADITVGPTANSSSSPGSASGSPSPTDSTPSANSSPTPTPKSQQIPEFPAIAIVMLLMAAAAVSTLLLSKKAKLNKK
jgi:hypothetical protein